MWDRGVSEMNFKILNTLLVLGMEGNSLQYDYLTSELCTWEHWKGTKLLSPEKLGGVELKSKALFVSSRSNKWLTS
jgi:hypothetical protein